MYVCILCVASYFLRFLSIWSEIFRHISSDCSCCLHALWSSSERFLIRAISFDALTLFGTFILNLAIGTFSNWIKLLMQSSATWTQDTIEQLHEEKGWWNASYTYTLMAANLYLMTCQSHFVSHEDPSLMLKLRRI